MLKTCIGALGAALFIIVPALGAEPDRSTLSYDDNVTINTACYAARIRGDGDFAQCVGDQVAALKVHPSPDRTQLSEGRNRAITRDCEYLRRIGVAEYNDCLAKAMAEPWVMSRARASSIERAEPTTNTDRSTRR